MHQTVNRHQPLRRRLLASAGAVAALSAAGVARADEQVPAIAALSAMLGNRELRIGKVAIDVPKLADNGNSVPLTITVESPMSETDRVVAIHVFSERNPRPKIASVELGPDAGRAELATRIRLAGTGNIVAVAQMADGSLWGATAEVIVTQAACTDDT